MKKKKRRSSIEVLMDEHRRKVDRGFKEMLPTWTREVGEALSIMRQERWQRI